MKFGLLSLLLVLCVSPSVASVGITTTSVPNGTVNSAYSATIRASGGCTPYRWALSGKLPSGVITITSSTTTALYLSGTPTTAGTYNFTIKVTGCSGDVSQVSYKVVIQAAASNVSITTTSVPNGTVSKPYSATIRASGGCTPYRWALSGKLPAGVITITSSTATALYLSGTPTTAGTYNFTIKVTQCGGDVSQVSYGVVIQAAANHVVELSWSASTSTNVVGYNIYRSPDGATWKKVNASLIASTLYSDATVANSTTYYYAATAVDTTGRESSKTAAVKVVVP